MTTNNVSTFYEGAAPLTSAGTAITPHLPGFASRGVKLIDCSVKLIDCSVPNVRLSSFAIATYNFGGSDALLQKISSVAGD